ncbi:MAG: hypothetical protein O2894_01180 [Planctomycetota bacterium]|nr:hypothetical protein [Planctomycetota bacterium]
MELGTGAVRYEFSGPGALGWYAAFVPDGSAFWSERLFSSEIEVWPTAVLEDRSKLAPTGKLPATGGQTRFARMASTGVAALARHDGVVSLRKQGATLPPLADLPGEGEVQFAFSSDGARLFAIRAGRLHVWAIPRAN